ncbi:MAG: hypothetical protein SGBAC_007661, partial [Bacillariaceae sp.]
MVKLTVILALVAGASAFTPQASVPVRSDASLDMANGGKRKALKKVAGAAGAFALATTGAAPAANAAKQVVETVDNTKQLIAAGAAVIGVGAIGMTVLGGEKKQDFLEASPYYDQSTVPVNTHKNKAPFTGKVVSTKRIVGPKATGETCHIIIDHKGGFPYWEGQSWGVIPPGNREKDGKPHS